MRGSLRVAVLAVAIAATGCHQAKPVALAWPTPSTTADDGGESIEPATTVASAVEKTDDAAVEAAPAAEIVAKPGAAAAEPEKPATVSPPTQPASDEVIMSEEIIIEIED